MNDGKPTAPPGLSPQWPEALTLQRMLRIAALLKAETERFCKHLQHSPPATRPRITEDEARMFEHFVRNAQQVQLLAVHMVREEAQRAAGGVATAREEGAHPPTATAALPSTG